MKVKIGKFPKGNGHRKIDVEIEHFDTWSLDHTLAHIIYPALLQLKAAKHGVPSEVVDDVGGEDWQAQDSFDFYKETHQEAFNEKCKEWDECLDKMIWAFEQELKEDDTAEFYDHSGVNHSASLNTQIGQIKVDRAALEAHEKRKSNAFKLFGKYYQSLWD